MMMKNYIGIDIGGTKIVFVLVKGRKVVKTKKIDTAKKKKRVDKNFNRKCK